MSTASSFEVIPISEVSFCGTGNGYRNVSAFLGAKDQPGPVVLVVDDEHIIADTLTTILRKSGFAVLTAYDAESALELARLVPPELLLTDCMMRPEMNGVELAMTVVAEVPDCRVLVFSGQAGTLDLVTMARERGHAFEMLSKPVHPTELVARVCEVMGEKVLAAAC